MGLVLIKMLALKVLSVVIVSNETIHKQNIAFSCNMKLLEIVRQHIPSLKKAISGVMVAQLSSIPDLLFVL